jgi:hypothetical protein
VRAVVEKLDVAVRDERVTDQRSRLEWLAAHHARILVIREPLRAGDEDRRRERRPIAVAVELSRRARRRAWAHGMRLVAAGAPERHMAIALRAQF